MGKKRQKINKKGFTLIEMLIYVGLMAVITLVIAQSLIVVLRSNRTSFAEINIRNAGYSAMEEILRQIYLSETVDQAGDGVLEMKQNSGKNVVKFLVSPDLVLNLYEGSSTPILVGPLTSKGVLVKNLIFTKIDTGKSLAIKIQMELETSVDNQIKDEWFNSTAILRGSYK